MGLPRFVSAVVLFAGWYLAGLLGAFALTLLYAFWIDPHGTGPVGEGIGFLIFFVFAAIVGLTLGYIRASILWSRRKAQLANPDPREAD